MERDSEVAEQGEKGIPAHMSRLRLVEAGGGTRRAGMMMTMSAAGQEARPWAGRTVGGGSWDCGRESAPGH